MQICSYTRTFLHPQRKCNASLRFVVRAFVAAYKRYPLSYPAVRFSSSNKHTFVVSLRVLTQQHATILLLQI